MKVLVTGGGTIAPIDDVRYIANVSSGRFSAAISEACLALGARVWHVHAPSALLPFERSARFDLNTDDPDAEFNRIRELHADYLSLKSRLQLVSIKPGRVTDYVRAMKRVLTTERIDVAFLAMAVSDYEPTPVAGKIDSSGDQLWIACEKSRKVIRSVKDWAPYVYLAGFKLMSGVETPKLIRNAEQACRVNRADVTVANELSNLREGRHTVHLVRPGHAPETFGPSAEMAALMVKRVFELASEKQRQSQ